MAAPPKTPPRSRQAATRREVFAAATGIHSARLARLYESADLDGNGRLSVPELRAFQHALVSECAYLHNESALRPDEFLAAGGGDCDDWALMTAGLLRYWGVPAWLGILKGQSDEGHAICLVRMIDPPADFVAFVLSEDSVRHGVTVPAGRYIPVDYEHVGDFSPASGPDPMLVDLFVPESAYGLPM